MTMDLTPDQVQHIATALQSRPVTYRGVARDLHVHVTAAKQMLHRYWLANKLAVRASYIVTGSVGASFAVHVFDSELSLDLGVKTLDKVHTVHVYALLGVKTAFSPAEVALEELKHPAPHDSLERLYKTGLIEGPPLQVSQGGAAAKLPVSSTPEPAQAKPKPKVTEQAKPAAPEKPKLVYQSRKQPQKESILASFVSKKDAPQKRPAEQPSYQYKSRKLEAQQPKERVVISNEVPDDADEDEPEVVPEEAPEPAPRTNPTTDLHKLFLDDDFSDDEPPQKDEPLQPVVVEHADDPAENDAAPGPKSAPKVAEDSIFRSLAAANSASATPTPPAAPEPQKDTVVDDDGYFTSYKQAESSDAAKKPAPRADPKPAAARTTKAKPSDGKKKQALLMSFFGKR